MRTALLPASLLAAALALLCAAPARAGILVTIDKTTQRMSVAVDGETRYVWPVSTGRPGYDTPNGAYRPFRMEADHFSKEWDDAPMPHSVFFTKIGHAIHGSLDTRHLGSAASHGCVRLSPEHASTLYALVQAEGLTDTMVVVGGQTPIATADGRSGRRQAARYRAGLRPAGRGLLRGAASAVRRAAGLRAAAAILLWAAAAAVLRATAASAVLHAAAV
jgi:lipoprotein-anchoring transpeptidase ErfK/SrfK